MDVICGKFLEHCYVWSATTEEHIGSRIVDWK